MIKTGVLMKHLLLIKISKNIGIWDIVYSWGVLHHTGQMWLGLENMLSPISPEKGILFIAIYNDEGTMSARYG